MAENKNPKKHQPWELEQMQSCPLYIKEPMSERRIMDWYPVWTQPLGASDAYMKDDIVSFEGSLWISTIDGNVWQPGVYGWDHYSE